MSTDITTLGMAVDSSGVRRATDDLEGMTQAGNRAAGAATGMEKSMVGAVLTANQLDRAIASTVNTIANSVRAWIQLGLAIGNYQDIADQTQIEDPAGIASMQTAADVAGISINSVALAMNRMQMQLSKVKDDSAPAARAVTALGLSFADFKKLSPDEQMRTLATAMAGYADGQGKVAIAQALFGRGGAEQLRLLKELGSETERNAILTSGQIRYADDLSDSLARNASQTRQMAAALAVNALPALDGLVTAGKEAIQQLLGIDKAGADLTKNDTVSRWAEGAVGVLGFVVDAGDGVVRVFRSIGLTIAAAAAQAAAVARLEFREAINIGQAWKEDLEGILNESLFSDRLARAIADARKRAADAQTAGSGDGKPKVDFRLANDKDDAGKKTKDAYDQVMASVERRLAQQTQELELGRELTASEKLRLDVYEKINAAKRLLTEAEADELENGIELFGLREKENAQRKEQERWFVESAKLTEQTIENARQQTAAYEGVAKAAQEELDAYGKTDDQLRAMEVSRLRDAAAALRAKRVVDDFNPALQQYNALLEQQAAALDDTANARERLNTLEQNARRDPFEGLVRAVQGYTRSVQDLGTETEQVVAQTMNSLESDLSRGLARGRVDVRSTIDYMIAEILRLNLVKPLLNSLFNLGLNLFSGGGMTIDSSGIGMTPGDGSIALPTRGGQAGGGFAEPFTQRRVNEMGTELFTDSSGKSTLLTGAGGGVVTPADKIGGQTFQITMAPTIRIDARSDQAQVAGIVNKALEENNKQFVSQLKSMGVV